MNVSLYQAASALNANARWQEVISENLASSTLPGYRKRDVSFAAVQAGVIQAQQGMAPTAMTRAEMTTSFQPGEIRVTGVNTNVAIDGKGFF
ncbi:hypothetical protein EG829_27135, partial [bacterium]|nr:hypothetical protein [bacterium]